jgi:hypothetical protein
MRESMALTHSNTGAEERTESRSLELGGNIQQIACGNRWHYYTIPRAP